MNTPISPIIIALDQMTEDEVWSFLTLNEPRTCALKVGLELFTAYGPSFVKNLTQAGYRVFLDLKYHDIPTQVAKAVYQASKLGIWMLTVHALGGLDMLCEARLALNGVSQKERPLLMAVTILTSLENTELKQLGFMGTVEENVLRLTQLSYQAGMSGVICSPMDLVEIKRLNLNQFIRVTPGIRPKNSEAHDQKRFMAPKDAIKQGAHYLVIGRPITQSDQPKKIIEQIHLDIQS